MKIKLSGLRKAGIRLFLPLASFVVRLGEPKQQDATLNQDILHARTQLFHNYDPLAATVMRQRELVWVRCLCF